MAYDITKRKAGSGFVKIAAHSGNSANTYGEIDFVTMKSETDDLGLAKTAYKLSNEPEFNLDEVQQQMYPVDGHVHSSKATFTVSMSGRDAQMLAYAVGESGTPASDTLDGDTFDVVVGGKSWPEYVTLLMVIPNMHDASLTDYLYMPRAKSMTKIDEVFEADETQTIDIEFALFSSRQDGTGDEIDMRDKDASGNATGNGGSWAYLEQTA